MLALEGMVLPLIDPKTMLEADRLFVYHLTRAIYMTKRRVTHPRGRIEFVEPGGKFVSSSIALIGVVVVSCRTKRVPDVEHGGQKCLERCR